MKKIIFVLYLFAFVGGNMQAQDTCNDFRGNYFYNFQLDAKKDLINSSAAWIRYGNGVVAKYFFNEDKLPLSVVGVAAVMASALDIAGGYPPENDTLIIGPGDTLISPITWYSFDDTTYSDCYEFLGVYKHFADSLQLIDSVRVHYLLDTPSYYYQPQGLNGGNPDADNPLYGVYERLFPSPLSLADSFYVGVTQRTMEPGLDSGFSNPLHLKQIPFCLLNYRYRAADSADGFTNTSMPEEHHAKKTYNSSGTRYHWHFDYGNHADMEYYCIFPILAVDDDTVNPINPGDTITAVRGADLVSRYVTLTPNPSTDRVRVLSSFGLTRIEVYDEQGRRMKDFSCSPARGELSEGLRGGSPLAATLDVSSWPRGTYLLRIHTPAWTTTKKLMVQ